MTQPSKELRDIIESEVQLMNSEERPPQVGCIPIDNLLGAEERHLIVASTDDVTAGPVIESLSIHARAEEQLAAELANAFRSESMEFAESEISEAVAVARKR